MPKTYYDSELTGAQIEDALEAIHGVVTPSNNGKVLCIVNGAISAKSASEWGHGAVLEPLSVTANGDYTPPTGADGFDSVHVAVPSYPEPSGTIQITQNGTVNVKDYASAEVNVSGGGSAVIQPLSVTQNGTYNPPSGVDGFAPVTVDVSYEPPEPVIGAWEQGLANPVGASSASSYASIKSSDTSRIRTAGMVNIQVGTTYEVSIDSGYKVVIYCFGDDGGYRNIPDYAGFWRDTFQFTAGNPYIAIGIRKDDNSAITPSEVANTGIAIHVVT